MARGTESLYNRMPVFATTRAIREFQGLSGTGLVVIDSIEDWNSFLNSSAAN
ncbi:MAG: hypothetical protein KC588_08420 [Nitrospira sp.]|nr:hypothetical protein [Nitrospira sp.]